MNVNSEKIVKEIRRDIAEKAYRNEIGLFKDVPDAAGTAAGTDAAAAASENLEALRAGYQVATWRPLKSERALGGIIVAFKKFVRKCIAFYVAPIVTDQNENNRLITACLQDMQIEMEAMRLRLQALEGEIERKNKK